MNAQDMAITDVWYGDWIRLSPADEEEHRIVIFRENALPSNVAFATHEEMRGPKGNTDRFWGHYNMSLDEAYQDARDRVAKLHAMISTVWENV